MLAFINLSGLDDIPHDRASGFLVNQLKQRFLDLVAHGGVFGARSDLAIRFAAL